ncbi:MAG: hypothetical protein AMXMBFR66_02100 [Pseudomonadota bacterium]|nr:hypothetical protein [Rubrivivax sp.]
MLPPARSRSLLEQRQRALLVRSAQLRLQIEGELQPLQRPLALAERLRSWGAWLRAHPEVPLAIVLGALILRPGRAWRQGRRIWRWWRRWRRLQRWVRVAAAVVG